MDFVHLHNHSYYSLLQSPSSPKQIISKAKEQGAKAVALTDNAVTYGGIEFYQECKKQNIKAILGMEVYLAPRTLYHKENKFDGRPYNLVLLAKDNTGYENLLKLSSIAHLEGMYYKPRIDKETLKKHSKGLIALSGGFTGEIHQAILNGKLDEDVFEIINSYLDIFSKENFYFEIAYRPNTPAQMELNEKLYEYGQKLKIPLVIGQNTYYSDISEQEAQDILTCIGTNRQFSEDRPTIIDDDYSMIDPKEIKSVFSEWPEAIKNTSKIADTCEIKFDLGKYHIPEFYPPKNHTTKTPIDYFRSQCIEGLKERYPEFLKHLEKINWQNLDNSTISNQKQTEENKLKAPTNNLKEGENIAKRFEYEFSIIKKMGFESYFLIVWDYIKWAKNNQILVGPGRGSGAGSIIAYALKITNINPLNFDLLFERFLNPERISMPDFDIDFQDNKRNDVIKYVSEKYGQDHVAQISTFGTMAARAAVKDVGRAFGINFQEMNDFAKLIPERPGTTLNQAYEEEGDLRTVLKENQEMKKVWDTAKKLEGVVRHISVHACAVVISKNPLLKYSALQYPPKDQTTIISQYSAHPLEDLGLLKMDFLGLKNLTILDRAIKNIKKFNGKTIDLDKIELEDEKTYEVFQKAQTTGIFQFESSGMKRYLEKLKPTVFSDLIAMAALYRPGPLNSGMTDSFIKRKNGEEQITYPHPSMEEALKDTYGVVVYQEQIMKLSQIMANFTGGQADTLRKAMGKKIQELMEKMKKEFIEGCLNNNISQKIAEKVWQGWEEFAKYGFNKSHSACYALIAYQTAYLKAYYPTEFMAALLTSDQNNADRVAIEIEESRNLNINILPPSVNESFHHFTVVKNREIRFGLNAIKNLGDSCAENIIKARGKENIIFNSLEDFLERMDLNQLNKKNLEALIFSGALDELGNRKQMYENLEILIDYAKISHQKKESGQIGLFENSNNSINQLNLPKTENFNIQEKLSKEKEYLGLFVSSHPLEGLEKYLSRNYHNPSKIKIKDIKTEKKFIGIINNLKIINTKKNNTKMASFTLQTVSGKIDIIVFPNNYEKLGEKIKEDNFVIVKGKIDLRDDNLQVISEDILEKNIETYIKNAKKEGVFGQILENQSTETPKFTKENLIDAKRKPWIIKLNQDTSKEQLQSMKNLIEKNPGKDEIILEFPNHKTVNLPQKVNLTKVLKSHLKQLLKLKNG
jgi:DNA polymerase-3 subunit alpha